MILGLALLAVSNAQTPTLQGYETEVASVIGMMMAEYHYKKQPVDDEASVRWFDAYVERLDYNRIFLLESDLQDFNRYKERLDDDLKSRKLDSALAIFTVYKERVNEGIGYAMEVLDEDLDLASDRMYVFDREKAGLPFPKNKQAAKALWHDRIVDQMIVGVLQEQELDERKKLLRRRYERIRKEVNAMDGPDVLEMYLGAFASTYDPHSVWFKPATRDNFDIDISNSVEGIGASLRVVDEYTTIMEIIAGGPADQDGRLAAQDRIVAVAQGNDGFEDVVDLRIDKVVRLIRGKKGTVVRLKIIPAGKPVSDTTIIDITRDRVLLAESDADKTLEVINGHKIGVINVPSFYVGARGMTGGVSDDVRKLLGELEKEGAEGVIIDLRRNGGGSLPEAVEMGGLFIGSGPVVQVRDRPGRVQSLNDPDRRHAWKKKVIVLTSPLAASASEIVAGALQDYERAIVVGAKQTHGKGTVQQVAPVSNMLADKRARTEDLGGALKVTIQKFYRVSGSSTQIKGVASDIVLPSPYDGLDVYEGDLDNALQWDTIPPAPHHAYGDLSGVIRTLAEKSKARVATDEGFLDLQAKLERRAKYKDAVDVPLDLEKRRALNSEMDDEPEEEEPEKNDKEEKEDDPVLDETLAIFADWLAL